MSIGSALILFRERLPSRAELEQQLAVLGYAIDLGKFELEPAKPGWVDVRVEGKKAGFEYGLFPLTEQDFGPFPEKALKVGDTGLSFGARGRLSIIAVSAVQHAISQLADAHGLIEVKLLSPRQVQRGSAQSIAAFSTADARRSDNDRSEMNYRMTELREGLLRLLIIVPAAALVIFGFPKLLHWLFR